MSVIINPIEQYFDTDGSPLSEGFLYFGEVYGNPVTQPVMVYFDPEFTIPAAQPVRTVNGYPVRSGTAMGLYAPQDVSILVQNKNMEQVLYIESSSIGANSTNTFYRESNTILTADDNNRTFIMLDSFTQTFDAAVTLGDRWRVNIINMSNGDVTLDPNLSETINGSSSYTLKRLQAVTVYSDGVNLFASTSGTLGIPAAVATGTVDALIASFNQTVNLALNPTVLVITSGTNTSTTVTLNGAPVVDNAGTSLPIGSMPTMALFGYRNLTGKWYLLNPLSTLVIANATNDPTFSSTSGTDAASPDWVKGTIARLKPTVDQSGSRSLTTTYTNTSGDYMVVSVGITTTVQNGNLEFLVDGMRVFFLNIGNNLSGVAMSCVITVPNGSTYRANSPSSTLNYWREAKL